MRVFVFWVLVVIGGGAGPAWAGSTLYRGATVFTLADGQDSGIAEGFVLVSGDRVVEAVGKGDPLEAPGVRARHGRADWRTVDLGGKVVMPVFVSEQPKPDVGLKRRAGSRDERESGRREGEPDRGRRAENSPDTQTGW